MSRLSSPSFARLVAALKQRKSTLAVVESCCGGLIQSSIMSQPGSSAVYYGGTVAYNTRKAKPLLLNDAELHNQLTTPLEKGSAESDAEAYIRSKMDWTSRTALAYCMALGTDYAIAEGGASGPTFRPKGLDKGFAALAVAARGDNGTVDIVKQQVVRSAHANREENMRLFADAAADLVLEVLSKDQNGINAEENEHLPYERTLDRATKLRSDTKELDRLKPTAKYVIVRDGEALFYSGWQLAKIGLDQVDSICLSSGATCETTFLGMLDGKEAVFGVDLLNGDKSLMDSAVAEFGSGASFEDVRTGAPLLSPIHNELVMHAMALAQWQRRSQFCSMCGSSAILIDGGTCRKCSSCNSKSWPRQDPSMIVAVSSRDGQNILLARSPRHPLKMHTALAGFIEAGEKFENAVAREVFEETGVRIDLGSVEYIGSQPWPFPQSTMIGFIATADDQQPLHLDKDELVEAGWFDRDQVNLASGVEGPVMRKEVAEAALQNDPSLPLLIPPKGVLARTLINAWLERCI